MDEKPVEGQAGYAPHSPWFALLTPREQVTIDHALVYARDFASAGVPGHSAHLLIAKLTKLVDRYAPNYIEHSFRPEDYP